MHVDPDVAFLADHRLTGVDAHPDANLLTVWPGKRPERPLRGDGGGNGVAGTLERVEERVALRIELPPAPGTERVAHDPPVIGECLRVPVAQPLEELRRALDVGEHERDRSAVQRRHALSRPASSASASASARRRRTRGFASLTISRR